MNQIKIFLIFTIIITTNVFADHNDQDYTCEDITTDVNYYGDGYFGCVAYNGNTGYPENLFEYISPTTIQMYTIRNYSTGASCSVLLPFLYTQSTTQQVCRHTPREPYVSYAMYEHGSCRFYTREGFITWEQIAGSSHQFEEKVGSNWVRKYEGNAIGANFAKQPGNRNKNYSLRVRAISGGNVGSWHYFNATVPACWNGGGVVVN